MMKATILALAICILIPCSGLAQNKTIDSLLKVLPTTAKDSNRVNTLNALSKYSDQAADYDTAHYYAQKALQLAQQLNFKKGLAESYYYMGKANLNQSNYTVALSNLQNALKAFTSLQYKKQIVASLNGIGDAYYRQGNYPQAMKNWEYSLKISRAIKDANGIATSIMNMGNIYNSQGNHPKALSNYIQALRVNNVDSNTSVAMYCYLNIGTIYQGQGDNDKSMKFYKKSLKIAENLGDIRTVGICKHNIGTIYQIQQDGEQALTYYQDALDIYKKIGFTNGVAYCYNDMGGVYLSRHNYIKALGAYQSALKIYKQNGSQSGMASAYNNIGLVYSYLSLPKIAKSWIDKGLRLSKKIGDPTGIKQAYYSLSNIEERRGNYKSALDHFKLYTVYKDSLFNEKKIKKISDLNARFKFQSIMVADSLKNAQAQQLLSAKLTKQKAYTWSGIGITVILIVLAGFIFYSNKKIAKERQKSDDLLLNILPAEISKELKEKGETTAQLYNHVTILFTDFVSFTKASERMSSQALVNELDACFKAFDNIASKHNIEKIKTIGDAYLAVSGLPSDDEKHAYHVVLAALEIRDFMVERRKKLGENTFEIRIGIHSGSVVAGIVGIRKFAYDIWGDAVNTAARMEQNSEPGKINVSEKTYQLIKGEFACVHRGKVVAKNKGELDMYFVEALA